MKLLTIIIFCLLFLSCDAGLAPPPPVELGFSGMVYFTPGSWPKEIGRASCRERVSVLV
jgi:hypothetical protein